MIDRKELQELREELEEAHELRDQILDTCRKTVQLSKRVIYSQQRGSPEDAASALQDMKDSHKKLRKLIEKRPDMLGNNFVRTAGQELVEAASYVALESGEDFPSAEELEVDALTYFLGLADLSGEVVRSAVLASIDGKLGRVKELREVLKLLYGELIAIDAREKDLRRKIDKVGYDLEKLENIMLDLSNKGSS